MAQRRGRPYWSWFPSAPFREERKSRVVATVEQLAALVRGRLVGDGSVSIHSARPVGEAGPGDITFIENERYAKMLRTSPASAAIVGPHFKPTAAGRAPAGDRGRRPDHGLPRGAPPPRRRREAEVGGGRIRRPGWRRRPGSAPTSRSIPFVYVGDEAEIGDGATLHPGVVVGDRCRVGARHGHPRQRRALSRRRSSATASRSTPAPCSGGDGFGYRFVDGRHVKVPQTGRVEVGDDVEIGANCTIDRATFEATRIGEGTKIDNLVMIGHNNQIGRHNLLCGQVGIAGSCKTGDYVVMAGQVGHQGRDRDRRPRRDRRPGGGPSQHPQRPARPRLAGHPHPRAAPPLQDDRPTPRHASAAPRALGAGRPDDGRAGARGRRRGGPDRPLVAGMSRSIRGRVPDRDRVRRNGAPGDPLPTGSVSDLSTASEELSRCPVSPRNARRLRRHAPASGKTVGLLAGSGRFPILFAEAARPARVGGRLRRHPLRGARGAAPPLHVVPTRSASRSSAG